MKTTARTALGKVFNLDYELTRGFMSFCAALSLANYVAFHWIEASMGFRDWIPLRVAACAVLIPILFFRRSGPFPWTRIAYWEFAVLFILPTAQTFYFFLNDLGPYWESSNMFWALFLGIATKPQWLPLHMVIGPLAGFGLASTVAATPDQKHIQDILAQQPLLWTTALATSGIKVGLEILYRRGVELARTRARADEAEKREAEIRAAYDELQRRETVIRRFVRPSLLEELTRGQNPVEFQPAKRNLAIMFCDIRDFTRLTERLEPKERIEFLNAYFSLMTHPVIENGGEVDKIMGDCVMSLFPDGRSAVRAAMAMRLRLQDFNRALLAQGKPKIRNGIGIAKGEVMVGNFGSFEKLDRTVIGEAVNIASRLESKTKMYNLEVVVTEEVVADLSPEDAHCRWIDLVQVKGSTRSLRLFEIYSHQPPEVVRFKDDSRDMMEKALKIYFSKGFKDAARLFRAMQEQVPPHRLDGEARMDDLLGYYIDHCDAWLSDKAGAWERMEKWMGVHVFTEK